MAELELLVAARHMIVLPTSSDAAQANGLQTDCARFPQYDHDDMVRAQHLVAT